MHGYVRGDLGFHEDEDEDQEGGDDGGSHHPGREGLLVPKRTDEPPPLVGGRHGEPRGHVELLRWGEKNAGKTQRRQ